MPFLQNEKYKEKYEVIGLTYNDITEEEMIEETIRKHKLQLECYAAAMRSSGKTIGRKCIYLIRYGKFVEI